MSQKILHLLIPTGFALLLSACGSDSSSGVSCDEGNCFDDEPISSSLEESSSSEKAGSSSSGKAESSSSEKASSSSSEKAESSSSEKANSSSSGKAESSSSEKANSSSSGKTESSSSTEESSSSEITYLNTTPNAADLEVSGDTLFAVFQRQSADYTIPEVGLLALYNAKNGELLDTIRLATKNPSAVKVRGGNVYVATSGEYDASFSLPADENRGIEKVDLKKKTSTLFVSGKKLGGGVNDFVLNADGTVGYAAIYKAYGSEPVVQIDFSTGNFTTLDGILNASGSLEFDEASNTLYIGEYYMNYTTYDMQIGVFAYDGKTLVSLTGEDETRPPYSIKILEGSPYVFVSDYSSGKLYMNYKDSEDAGVSYYQDSKLAAIGNALYLMERSTTPTLANIAVTNGKPTWQVKLDDGSNPYDLVSDTDGNLWVALYGTAEIRKVSAADGSRVASIDTRAFCAHE